MMSGIQVNTKNTFEKFDQYLTLNSIILVSVFILLTCQSGYTQPGIPAQKPNFIIIFCDDLGYGDLECYGHPTIQTPHIDQMAAAGQRWTSFYAAASVCTPSRAGLLTGRLPARSGMASNHRRVLFPDSDGGLPDTEITIAELLRTQKYATACIGKWHLGHLTEHLPTNHGFDYYFGIPYSNDMDGRFDFSYERFKDPQIDFWNVPLMSNQDIIERPVDQTTITRRYTQEAIRFIRQHKSEPFFVYLAHTMPHVPLFRSRQFEGVSRRGRYGDVIAEIDAGVGQLVQALVQEGLAGNTLVVFTSDNGPWLACEQEGGSAGLLAGGKGMTWEGGMREPAIFWWPGRIEPAVIADMGSTLDLLPTLANLAGCNIPDDRIIDGYDLQPVLFYKKQSPRKEMFFYRGTDLYAVRVGSYKAHYITEWAYAPGPEKTKHDPPLLFNLDIDPSEKYNIAAKHPEILAQIGEVRRNHEQNMILGKDRLVGRIQKN